MYYSFLLFFSQMFIVSAMFLHTAEMASRLACFCKETSVCYLLISLRRLLILFVAEQVHTAFFKSHTLIFPETSIVHYLEFSRIKKKHSGCPKACTKYCHRSLFIWSETCTATKQTYRPICKNWSRSYFIYSLKSSMYPFLFKLSLI